MLSEILRRLLHIPTAEAQGAFKQGFTEVKNAAVGAGVNVPGSPTAFIISILTVVAAVLAAIALAALLYGGFLYITSLGEEDRARTAKRVILYAIIGIIVIGAAGILVNVIISFI